MANRQSRVSWLLPINQAMNVRRTSLLLLWIGLVTGPVLAQQEAQMTQFMFHQLLFTPAAAGSQGGPCLRLLARSQWIGLEGAPESQLISADLPLFQQRVGLGLNLHRQSVGITRKLTAELAYAYRMRLGEGTLGLGLSGSLRYYAEDYRDERLVASQGLDQDPSIPEGLQSRFLPNFGGGVYYQGRDWYAGAGLPRLLEGRLDFGQGSQGEAREVRHLYLLGGYRWRINPFVALHPQVLVKALSGALLDADIHLAMELLDQFHLGATYRIGGAMDQGAGESVNVILGMQLREMFMLSVGYDIALTDLRTNQNGTFEALVRLTIGEREAFGMDNPRFFE